MTEAVDDLQEAISHVVARLETRASLSPAEAAVERVGLLERHLERLGQLRAEHLGGTP